MTSSEDAQQSVDGQYRDQVDKTTFDMALPWGSLKGEDATFSSAVIHMFQDAIKDEAAQWHSFMEKHVANSLGLVDDWAQQQGPGGVLSEMVAAATAASPSAPRQAVFSSSSARREALRAEVAALREQRKAATAADVQALLCEVETVGASTLRLRRLFGATVPPYLFNLAFNLTAVMQHSH